MDLGYTQGVINRWSHNNFLPFVRCSMPPLKLCYECANMHIAHRLADNGILPSMHMMPGLSQENVFIMIITFRQLRFQQTHSSYWYIRGGCANRNSTKIDDLWKKISWLGMPGHLSDKLFNNELYLMIIPHKLHLSEVNGTVLNLAF